MQRAMLTHEYLTVDAYNLTVGEGLLQDRQCLGILDRLAVGRHENGTVDDKEVGIGGWQTLLTFLLDEIREIALDDSIWQRNRKQTVWMSVRCAKSLELLLHGR